MNIRLGNVIPWLLAVILISSEFAARAAMDIFLKIDTLEGESTGKNHEKEIDVLAWSWGMSNPGIVSGGTGGTGKVNVQALSVTKWLDKSTPQLILATCNGKHYTKATLTLRKAGENPLEFLIITMEDVIVTSVSMGGSGGEDRLTENVTFQFAKFKFSYAMESATGTTPDKFETGWNIAENVKY